MDNRNNRHKLTVWNRVTDRSIGKIFEKVRLRAELL